jgi:Ca2+-binding EF-hand superfamily protein
MARSFRSAALAAAVCLLYAAPSTATAQNASPRLSPANQYLFSMLPMDITLQRYLDHLRNQFRQADADMNGELNQADIDIHASVAAAHARMMLSTMILRADLDGDGVVTADELRRVMRYERRLHPRLPVTDPGAEDPTEIEVRRLMQADADRDGRITHAEAMNFAKAQPDYVRIRQGLADSSQRMMAAMPAGKTGLTVADLEIGADALFRTIDTNGDGKISIEEHKAYRDHPDQPHIQAQREAQLARAQREQQARDEARIRAEKEAEKRAVCAMPKASEAAKVMLLGAYQTGAISNVTLGSQDIAVGVGNVTIEPGAEPLYLVIGTFRPTIWRFYGAVERIERLV